MKHRILFGLQTHCPTSLFADCTAVEGVQSLKVPIYYVAELSQFYLLSCHTHTYAHETLRLMMVKEHTARF